MPSQLTHTVLPEADEYVPSGHAVQVEAFLSENVPALHDLQSYASPDSSLAEYFPALQAKQVDEIEPELYWATHP